MTNASLSHQLELNQQPLVNVFEAVIGNLKQLAVNARDLHTFLQVGKVFAAWIQERTIKQ
ncbi:antA/AntB antirepressor family protein [Acinetobacter sp. ANC5681]|uniref:antA/AntB antirepressor family protein n=1 Tax=Acinetobacter sp. ANC5681 TaxID=2929504 RepID=UPI00201A4C81|nr:antA/AntB antirepressor family protein [Acinetobacter sp. ANC5681]MCL5769422.1 antA/AntB antirepressor family protein [Acinetobacter sp. ANC5681]